MAKSNPLTLQWSEQTKATTTLTLPDGSPLVFETDKQGVLKDVDPQYKADLLGAGYTVVKQAAQTDPEPESAPEDTLMEPLPTEQASESDHAPLG